MRQVRIKDEPAQPGKAIQAQWTTRRELAKLRALIVKTKKQGDLRTWRRGKAVWDYINGKKVIAIAAGFEVARAAVNQWLRWYDTAGTEALWPRKAPGPAPRLSPAQHVELTRLIEAGPQAAGYTGGVWTGPRIGDLIRIKRVRMLIDPLAAWARPGRSSAVINCPLSPSNTSSGWNMWWS